MANINVQVCDLCKSIADAVDFEIRIGRKGSKAKERVSAEICEGCFNTTLDKINKELQFNKTSFVSQNKEASIIPSANATPIANRSKQPEDKCTHYNKTIGDDGKLVCRKCGEVLPL